jgi:flagellar assembly factor FliW
MQLDTLQFGQLNIDEKKIISFPKGLLGFEGLTQYVIVEVPECLPFCWLQSVESPELALVIVDPSLFYPGYQVRVHAREVADIGARSPNSVEIYAIVTVPAEMENMTVNLQGPLLVNQENNTAKQLVLTDSDYSVQHPVLSELQRRQDSKTPSRSPVSTG